MPTSRRRLKPRRPRVVEGIGTASGVGRANAVGKAIVVREPNELAPALAQDENPVVIIRNPKLVHLFNLLERLENSHFPFAVTVFRIWMNYRFSLKAEWNIKWQRREVTSGEVRLELKKD